MAKERIETIFGVGENTSTLGTDNEVGTGLGLVLCKEFTERNNGKILAESEPEGGSTFTILLHLAQ